MKTPNFKLGMFLAIGLTLGALILPALPARAVQPIVADLSKHLIAITTGFSGADVLLFGAVEHEGDVILVVRGPTRGETVRHKTRQAGIWLNSGQAVIDNAPALYQVAATRPLADIASPQVLDAHRIGIEHLALNVKGGDANATKEEYRDALIRLKRKVGLYGDKVQDIGFLSHRLFRANIHFPANVPVGTYSVEAYFLSNGQVVGTQTTPLVISKTGLGADIYDFAHRQGLAYGILSIVLAAATGWMAAIAFRKG